jgi:[amino group carrier protein]-lysine/ornithine hydrolase
MLEALNLLRQAVSIPSVSGQEREVAEYLVTQMSTFAETFVDEAGNAVAKLGKGKRHVVFLGHIDTVPGEIPVRVKDSKLYGRGAVDAKGPFCAAIMAASQLGPEVLDKLRITLIGAVEEEAPSSKGARHAVRAYEQPDAVIIGEPSGWDAVTLGYKGRLVVKLKHEKDNFHSAGDDSTAAEDMVRLWLRLEAWAEGFNKDSKGIFERVQLSLQEIRSASDGLTQWAEATIGLRLPPFLPPAKAKEALAPLLAGTDHAFTGEERAYRGDKDTALTRAFRLAIRDLGGRPRVKVKTGTSDMNVVAPSWRVPMLAYGPGDASLDHRPDEHLVIEDYLRAIEVLTRVFARLAG